MDPPDRSDDAPVPFPGHEIHRRAGNWLIPAGAAVLLGMFFVSMALALLQDADRAIDWIGALLAGVFGVALFALAGTSMLRLRGYRSLLIRLQPEGLQTPGETYASTDIRSLTLHQTMGHGGNRVLAQGLDLDTAMGARHIDLYDAGTLDRADFEALAEWCESREIPFETARSTHGREATP